MFDRSLLKSNAKIALKRFYGTALIVLMIVNVITGVSFSVNVGGDTEMDTEELSQAMTEYMEDPSEESLQEFTEEYAEMTTANSQNAIIAAVASIGSLLSAVFSIFVANVINVGHNYFYLRAREYPAEISDIFASFKKRYLNTVGTMFCSGLYQVLWSLLFIIPGIVKAYEYSMIPYILAENPNVDRKKAFELSKAMTDGYKWELFVLGLSFIGWQILGVLCCGIGGFFLTPYINATNAEAYVFLKARAIENGLAQASDFTGIEVLPTAEANA